MRRKQVCVALVGAGHAAILHGNGYMRVSGVSVRLKTIVDIDIKKAEVIRASSVSSRPARILMLCCKTRK